ncbi:MAG: DUF5060 domain-containing protein [Endomicrobiia bacterium]
MKSKILVFINTVLFAFFCSGYSKDWYVLEDFEGVNYWSIVSWKTATKAVSISKEIFSEGEKALKVDFENSDWSEKAQVMIEQFFDFSGVEKISMDIYNPNKETLLTTMALCTGDKWEWYESPEQRLVSGWNKEVTFNLRSPNWKAERSGWRNIIKVENLKDVRRITLTFVGGRGPVYIDNIKVYGEKKIDKISPTIKQIGDKILFESFEEDKTQWSIAGWRTQAVEVKFNEKWATDGKKSLELIFEDVTDSNKASYCIEGDFNWEKVNRFYIDVFNPLKKNIKINLALSTGGGWIWYESPDKVLTPGENKDIEFDLNAKNFKCEATNWTYSSYVKHKEKVKRIAIQVIAPQGETLSGSVSIDNLRITEGEPLVIPVEIKPPKYPEVVNPSRYSIPKIKSITSNLEMVGQYEKFELTLEIDSYFENPYNPNEVLLTGIFISPDGKTYRVPGFYYEDFREETGLLKPTGKKYWKIRFSPNKIGSWDYYVEFKNPAGKIESKRQSFECVSSRNKGIIVVSESKNYFKFITGGTYFPLGQNVCWVTASDNWKYSDYLRKLSETGQNWTRLWNCPWGFIIEWGEPRGQGLGRYNQKDSFEFDRIIELAEKLGIYIQFCLDYHGAFDEEITWEQNAYNFVNGGPCKKPIDFFKDETAKEYYKRRLRYVVARWGYSCAIMAWEFLNEADLISDYDENILREWHKEMATYLKEIDYNGHLITTSFARAFAGDTIFKLPEISYTQTHMYTDEVINGIYSIAIEKRNRYKKPHFFGEIGGAITDASVEAKDKKGILLHDTLWASVMSLNSGTAMYWWWDGHIKPNNLYYHYAAVSKFLKGIDYDSKNFSLVEAESIGEADYTDLVYSPPLDWEKSIMFSDMLLIDKSGLVKGGLLSRYFQSPKWHKDMYVVPTFSVEYPTDGSFSIYVLQSAKIGANLKIYIDDKLMLSEEFPKGRSDFKIQKSFSVPVSKGKHIIKIINDGDDWFNVGNLTFTNLINKCQVVGIKSASGDFILLWLKNPRYNVKNYLSGIQPPKVKNARIQIKDVNDGDYNVEFWDTWNGNIVSKKNFTATNKTLVILVPEFDSDIACKIYK